MIPLIAGLLAGPALVVLATPAPRTTTEILLTAERGEKLAKQPNVALKPGKATGTVITVYPKDVQQTVDGIGSSFTESAAFVLAHLEPAKRREVMQRIFGADGANFTLTRTHIGACDFSVEGKYSYAEQPGDTALAHFSIAPDTAGFDAKKYPGVKDARYDLLPMIQEAIAIKKAQRDPQPRIVASAWTAPPWMKDIEDWYIPGAPANNWQGTGGSLKPEHHQTYADYIVKYLDAYKAQGVAIWGLTPVNEPHGNNGQWESMHFTPQSQRDFVRDHLGPALKKGGHGATKLMVYDQNRREMEEWADVILGAKGAADHVYGLAVHWYASTVNVYGDLIAKVRAKYPDKAIVQTEGCIDDLGKPAPKGIKDPKGFQEEGWFNNDAWWWNRNATDWAYTAPWKGAHPEDHPMYVPVHRVARDLIVGLHHGLSGWIDWNIVLDAKGGPNHVGNYCGAPIMIDTATGTIHYTPIFHVLAQFSRTIRPGDRVVRSARALSGLDADALHAVATVNDEGLLSVQLLNTTKAPITLALQIGDAHVPLTMPANAVQTVRLKF